MNELIKKIINGFNFTPKDFLFLIILLVFLMGGYNIYLLTENTNIKINEMDERYFHDIEDNAFSVLTALQNNNILEPKDIVTFLESKPAGKSDLKKGLENEKIYERLVNVFDGLAKNAKKALLY